MEFIQTIAAPFKVYPGGIIAVRAADFIGAARGTLSLVSDATSDISTAVQESQGIAWVDNGSGIANLKTMFNNADVTIEIPWDNITYQAGHDYDVYLRYKMTGGRSGAHLYLSGVITATWGTFIDCTPSTDDPVTSLGRPNDQLKESPFWQYAQLRNFSGNATSGESIRIKALTESDNDAIFLIDQVVLVPRGTHTVPVEEISEGWGSNGGSGLEPSFNNDDPRAGDFQDWVGGKFTLYEAQFKDITAHENGDILTEFQKAADYASAEYTDAGVGEVNWNGKSFSALTGVGISWYPDYTHFFHDDFNRTVGSGWGTKDDWLWETVVGLQADVLPGMAQIGAASDDDYAMVNLGVESLTTHSLDIDPSFGLKIEATVGWDTAVLDGSYVACVGYLFTSSGFTPSFYGLAILKDGGSWYGVIIMFNPNTLLGADAGVREISSRVLLSGSQPLDVVVERKYAALIATVEGNTLTAYESAIDSHGGIRTWEDYPYATAPIGHWTDDIKKSGNASGLPGFFMFNHGTTAIPTLTCYCSDFKLSWTSYGTQPDTAELYLEKEITGTPQYHIQLKKNAFQMISHRTDYYGSIAEADGDFWKYKAFLPPGTADLGRIEFYSNWFRKVICPDSIFWFYVDGEWHQQNVDTDYSLWVFKDGEWVQDCTELQGYLEGTWQT